MGAGHSVSDDPKATQTANDDSPGAPDTEADDSSSSRSGLPSEASTHSQDSTSAETPHAKDEDADTFEVFTLTPEVMRSWLRTAMRSILLVLGSYYALCTLLLIAYRWVDPPITGVQIQRSVAAWWTEADYERSYEPVSLREIDDDLELAVVSAEDTRFFQHTGIDWKAIGEAIEDNRERGRMYRGGSTITQQLAKNLFQTTHSSLIRKGLEVPLTYLTELLLPKERILELYLNVIEWGPGVFGAEAASRYHYGHSADTMSRWHAAALAACIPNPLVRRPRRMDSYARTILGRMRQVERFEAYF